MFNQEFICKNSRLHGQLFQRHEPFSNSSAVTKVGIQRLDNKESISQLILDLRISLKSGYKESRRGDWLFIKGKATCEVFQLWTEDWESIMSTTHHHTGLSRTHRQFLHGYYVLPCCSAQHCGFQAPTEPIRHVRQPSFSIESILNNTSTPRPSSTTSSLSMDFLRKQGAASLSTSLSPLQRLQPYPECYSRTLSSSIIDDKGKISFILLHILKLRIPLIKLSFYTLT
jgi:hypothetical protein